MLYVFPKLTCLQCPWLMHAIGMKVWWMRCGLAYLFIYSCTFKHVSSLYWKNTETLKKSEVRKTKKQTLFYPNSDTQWY